MKAHVEWFQFHMACFHTAHRIKKDNIDIDTIIGISRGGLIPARIMAEYLRPDRFYTIGVNIYNGQDKGNKMHLYQDLPETITWEDCTNILIVDDISDEGTTLKFVYDRVSDLAVNKNILTACPYIKAGTQFVPTYYVTKFDKEKWIVFPFEVE